MFDRGRGLGSMREQARIAAPLMLAGAMGCGHEGTVDVPGIPPRIKDAGVADARASTFCDNAEPSEMSCQNPFSRRMMPNAIHSYGRGLFVTVGRIRSASVPTVHVTHLDENCEEIRSYRMNEGTSNRKGSLGLHVSVPVISTGTGIEGWAQLSLRDASCTRSCQITSQVSEVKQEGEPLEMDTPDGKRVFTMDKVDRTMDISLHDDEGNLLWRFHHTIGNFEPADFGTSIGKLEPTLIDFAGKSAKMNAEWQQCSFQ
jgi:hypothetical protein